MVTSDHATIVHSSQPGHLPRCRHLAHRCNEIIQCNGLATVQSLNLPDNNLTDLCIGILNHVKERQQHRHFYFLAVSLVKTRIGRRDVSELLLSRGNVSIHCLLGIIAPVVVVTATCPC